MIKQKYEIELKNELQCNEADVARLMLDELIRSVVVDRLEAYKSLNQPES